MNDIKYSIVSNIKMLITKKQQKLRESGRHSPPVRTILYALFSLVSMVVIYVKTLHNSRELQGMKWTCFANRAVITQPQKHRWCAQQPVLGKRVRRTLVVPDTELQVIESEERVKLEGGVRRRRIWAGLRSYKLQLLLLTTYCYARSLRYYSATATATLPLLPASPNTTPHFTYSGKATQTRKKTRTIKSFKTFENCTNFCILCFPFRDIVNATLRTCQGKPMRSAERHSAARHCNWLLNFSSTLSSGNGILHRSCPSE